ncbi:hypothetical protein [Leifsonia sp. Leaf336]|uniref:hypothetical protein n=1 Tax=Leifsonia sp. Leaf336 TaxID=1736341 RepID=UPI000B24F8C7|nr:hypothetical protein [Leifsonia sp. Leaf336]
MNDGWHLDGDISSEEMRMRHLVTPPAWRLLIEFLNPVAWLLGPTYPTVYRRMHVRVDEGGRLHRRTTGKIPPDWPQSHSWEAPDGPVDP